MSILVVGGDSVSAITERAYAGGHGCVEHWSGRKTRDLTKSIPKDMEAVVLVLYRVNHWGRACTGRHEDNRSAPYRNI
ncbi:MAG: hypothetical protein WBB60_14325 [Nitrospira sp.]